ncbi:MAG: hypothetical protein MHM6MM_004225 [Cercozoa sp. M6MM]
MKLLKTSFWDFVHGTVYAVLVCISSLLVSHVLLANADLQLLMPYADVVLGYAFFIVRAYLVHRSGLPGTRNPVVVFASQAQPLAPSNVWRILCMIGGAMLGNLLFHLSPWTPVVCPARQLGRTYVWQYAFVAEFVCVFLTLWWRHLVVAAVPRMPVPVLLFMDTWFMAIARPFSGGFLQPAAALASTLVIDQCNNNHVSLNLNVPAVLAHFVAPALAATLYRKYVLQPEQSKSASAEQAQTKRTTMEQKETKRIKAKLTRARQRKNNGKQNKTKQGTKVKTSSKSKTESRRRKKLRKTD